MPYTAPTYDEFTARFPVFADADQPVVEALLVEAARSVDNSWDEGDYQPAILYLTAHLLATDNSEEGTEAEIGGAGGGQITSESFGGISTSYAAQSFSAGALSADDEYGTTVYGRRYLGLLKRNRGGPLIA